MMFLLYSKLGSTMICLKYLLAYGQVVSVLAFTIYQELQ